MRIAHVVYSCVPGCFRGGIAKAVFELSAAQAALGHEVDIYTTNVNSSESTDIQPGSVRTIDGVRIRYFGVREPRWFTSPDLDHALRENIDACDVVHAHNTYLALNRYAARASAGRKRLFFHVHGALDPVVVRKGLLRRARKELYIRFVEQANLNAGSGVIALSEAECLQIRSWGVRSPVHVVGNGINGVQADAEGARVFRASCGIADDAPIVSFVGRIAPKKAIHVLVEAFARTPLLREDGYLVIAGDRRQYPEYTRELDRLIQQHRIERRVIWPGFVDEVGKRRLLSATSVFSHVTESEGMAIAPLEAMSAALPTLVSEGCYMDGAMKAGAVVQVDCNADALARALDALVGHPEQLTELGSRAQAYVARNHAWPLIATEMVHLYENAAPAGTWR